jgi:anti-sigma regulatory factor (Ser/Thr protein kinase)
MLVYDADAALAGFVERFVTEGRDGNEPVVAVYVPEKQSLLRDALGPAGNGITFADAREVYTRPEAAVSRYAATLRRLLSDGASSVRVVGELPICETEWEWNTWMLYEALLNRVFDDFPAHVVCTYDERVVPEPVMQASLLTHPRVHDGEWHDSPHFHDPAEMVRALTPEPQPLPHLREVPAGDDAASFREQLAREMRAAAVLADEALAMLLAAGEIYVNALRHGRGAPTLRVGRYDGRFVCELSDRGNGLDDPLAGYVPPRVDAEDGAGLWVARQLTSRVEFLPTLGGGLTTRLWT